ncbi:hypothetical protein DFH07DRAFT_770041 [Mycena maculata]|uniref:Uncharacterized protein n=1 Tax=Mycena maculata TaxID=230809 RepID=A0AAD7NL85_9AGAR|nr:hypothetical protein DFH07DRAFT_770041 [Mycena maculata]
MQFKVIAFIAALFAVTAAQTDCVTILDGSICPMGYSVCGPVEVGQTKCCPRPEKINISRGTVRSAKTRRVTRVTSKELEKGGKKLGGGAPSTNGGPRGGPLAWKPEKHEKKKSSAVRTADAHRAERDKRQHCAEAHVSQIPEDRSRDIQRKKKLRRRCGEHNGEDIRKAARGKPK